MRLLPPLALAAALCVVHGAALAADTPIYAIQGSGHVSPLLGQTVTTTGVVTKVNNNGYFLQDAAGDNDPATSDGIFVFTSTAPTVTAGQLIRVTGVVAEFDVSLGTSNPPVEARPLTELTVPTGLTLLGSGSITPTAVTLPEAVEDDLEHVEGMLVTIAGPFTVDQNYFQGRYGQLTLSVGGRLETPTNRFRAGTPQAQALADENRRRRILLDDGRSTQNPNPTPYFGADGLPRAGDRIAALTGVIDFGLATSSAAGYADYKLHPTVAPVITVANPRPATPPAVGGNVKLAAFNVLNYFTTFTNGSDAFGNTGQKCTQGNEPPAANLCRGANNAAEFTRQRTKIVEAIATIGADALGLMEIQNNGLIAAQNLVDGLNAKLGAGTYAVVPDPAGGAGSDAIKTAILYKPARLTRIGASLADTAAVHSRPPIAQTFAAANGERFTLIVNHFKSKGSCPVAGDPDFDGNDDNGDGQGCWNARRVQQAQALRSFVAQVQAGSGSNDVLITGDLNAYGQEDPVADLTSSGYVDQMGRFSPFAYSYVFDGGAGRLDHAITSASMSPKVMGAAHWHINADEGLTHDYNLEFKQPACPSCAPDPYAPTVYKASDHDPVLLGMALFKTIQGTANRDLLVGSAGDDVLVGGAGADRLTGGAGINVFAYNSLRDAGDKLTDFVPGKDLLDLRTLLAGLGWNGSDPVAEGWLRFVGLAAGTDVQIDSDGPGSASFRSLLTLLGVSPAALDPARDLIVH
jgi:predicted extracellular nuclease